MITRSLPCTPVVDGVPSMFDFTGHDVGVFFIHKEYPDKSYYGESPRGNWSVTHTSTGLSVCKHIRSKARAITLAKKLGELECWDFTDPEGGKRIPKDKLKAIHFLKATA